MTTLREAAQQVLEWLDQESWPGFDEWVQEGRAIRASLRAALAEPTCKEHLHVEPVQEPVAWLSPRTVDSYMRPDLGYETCSKTDYGAFPVYTHPAPQRQPLIADEICDSWEFITGHQIQFGPSSEGRPMYLSADEVIEFARAIERAHGIGGQDE